MVVLGDAFQGIVAGLGLLVVYLFACLVGGWTHIGGELGQLRNWDGLVEVDYVSYV